MRHRILLTPIALILVLTVSPIALTQISNPGQSVKSVQDWQGLRDLKPRTKVLIEYKNSEGELVEGTFLSTIGSRLFLSSDSGDVAVEQRDILRIYRAKGGWSRGKTARIGAVIGMVLGTVIGARRMTRLEERPGHVPSDEDIGPLFGGFTLGTLAGAGAGALLGGKRKGELLFVAD